MRDRIRKPRLAAMVGVVAVVAGTTFALGTTSAFAASASDPTRANFVGGNAVNCAQVGFPGSTLAFADGNDSIEEGGVSGEVVPNTSPIGDEGEMVNVEDPTGGAVIDAVIVKGGPAYNVYSQSSGTPALNHVPPTEDTPTMYVSPFNGGGNIPAVSHWFICYHPGEEPPETGSLAVTKDVMPFVGPGIPVAAPPATFTINVSCDDDTDVDLVLPTFEDEVANYTGVVTGIADGAECTVTELDTNLLPLGSTVKVGSGDPVTILLGAPSFISGPAVGVDGGAQTAVLVSNVFTGIEIQVSPADVTKAADPVVVSPAFTG
jgi:hypothetical protein